MDPVISFVLKEAIARFDLEKAYLFGSRAKNSATDRSDYDLAFLFPAEQNHRWVKFVLDIEESVPTLKGIDLISLNDCSAQLKTQILNEGKLLYERKA